MNQQPMTTNDYTMYPDFSQMPYYSRENYMNQNLLALLSPQEVIEQIEHSLRGEKWDHNKQCWRVVYNQLINDQGINTIMQVISSHVSSVFQVSNFSDEHINRICADNRDAMIDLLSTNALEWGINVTHLTTILNKIDNLVFAMLRQSFDNGTRNFLNGSYQAVERAAQPMMEEKRSGSWLSNLNPFKRKENAAY